MMAKNSFTTLVTQKYVKEIFHELFNSNFCKLATSETTTMASSMI